MEATYLVSWRKSKGTRWTGGGIVNDVNTSCQIEHYSILAAVLCDNVGMNTCKILLHNYLGQGNIAIKSLIQWIVSERNQLKQKLCICTSPFVMILTYN